MKKIFKVIGWLLLAMVIIIAGLIAWDFDNFQRHFLGGVKVYETEAPTLPDDIKRPAILVFSKTNGYRHADSIAAANTLFDRFAAENEWGIYKTENGAAFNAEILSRFDAVIFNNVSGDVFTPDQRAALKSYIENGGGFVGIHGSGGDPSYEWAWYVDELIGAQFIGHTMDPQFETADFLVEDRTHPATAGLPAVWPRTEEIYSFDKSVRAKGYNVLVGVDEKTYSPKWLLGQDIKMGKDHPIVWSHCQKNGRALYSAMGHQASAYTEPNYQKLLLGATRWALRLEGTGCELPEETAKEPAE